MEAVNGVTSLSFESDTLTVAFALSWLLVEVPMPLILPLVAVLLLLPDFDDLEPLSRCEEEDVEDPDEVSLS